MRFTNRIWVKLEAVNLKLLHSCMPVVTISGLMNTQTESSLVEVTDVQDNNKPVQAKWSNSPSSGVGILELNLTKLFTSEAADKEDVHKTSFLFHFTVINPATAQVDNVPKIEASLSRKGSKPLGMPLLSFFFTSLLFLCLCPGCARTIL